MVTEGESTHEETCVLTRMLSVPVLTLLLALLLIYTRSPTGDPGSAFSIKFPEVLGGEYLRNGLRTIARSYLDFHAFPAD
jgi:hypothetical protein